MEVQQILRKLIQIPKTPKTSRANQYDHMLEGYLDYNVSLENYERMGAMLTLDNKPYVEQNLVSNIESALELEQMMIFDHQDAFQQQLSDRIVDLEFSRFRFDLHNNKNNQLESLEQGLCAMLQQNQINLNNFSQNSLTNIGTYSHNGSIQQIKYVTMPMQYKRYTDEEILNKIPHPVRMRRFKKLNKNQDLIKKSEQEVLQEFSLLSNLFTIEQNHKEEFKDYQQIIDIVGFNDAEYNDLWQDILKGIDLNQYKEKKVKLQKQVANSEDKFNETVDRIIKETAEYVRQTLELQQPEEQDSEKQDVLVQEKIQQIKQTKKPAKVYHQSKHQYAIEDQSDLLHFYDQLPREKFAIQFPFELDQFQKRSVLHLQRKQSVFVAAHTSAGKTVIAEYGIALAIKHKRKVIYTSPIKALSNQKYREFSKKFGSVGIVTGDITLNQTANCVIMTTEILRNALYKGADMIRDIEWVIFDQVHYINNQERGVVWEETIIMLPQHIGIIMLSATVPNFMDFANWVGRTKRKKIYVMKTFHRPVPLEHSLYILDKFHVIKEPKGDFLKKEYQVLKHQIHLSGLSAEDLKQALKAEKKKKIQQRGFYKDNKRQQNLKMQVKKANDKFIKNVNQGDVSKDRQQARIMAQLIQQCRKQKLLPCVIFCFSKRKIHTLVETLYTTRLNTNEQAHKVVQFFGTALMNLKPQDKVLNQFQSLLQFCKNGYAIHHGDLLPLAKQIVQLLFSEGLIKVLIATETFAMGINMPTKTVIFHSIKKFTGANSMQRFLNSSEYVQMSGRAGRRGLDVKGNVIIMVKDPQQLPESAEMIRMIDHPGEALLSKFRITYQIILNLFNSKDINVQQMMRQSFYEDPKFSSLPANQARIKQYKKTFDQLSEFVCEYNQLGTRLLIEDYIKTVDRNRQLNQVAFSSIQWNKTQLPKIGLVLGHNNETQLCMVLKIDSEAKNNRMVQVLIVNQIDTDFYITRKQREQEESLKGINKKKRILLQYQNSKSQKIENGAVPETKNKFHYYVHWIKASELVEIYSNKIPTTKYASYGKQAYEQFAKTLMEESTKKLNILHTFENLNKPAEFRSLKQSKCHACVKKQDHTRQYQERSKIKSELINLISKVDKDQLSMMGNFQGMVRVLEQYKFISSTSMLLKGKVARQVDIYVTQIMVEAILDPLDNFEIAALLSGFVNQHRKKTKKMDQKQSPFNDDEYSSQALVEAMNKTHKIIIDLAKAEVRNDAFIVDDEDQLINNILNFHLAQQIYDWAAGVDFIDICDTTDAPEGNIVKTILRLDILLRNMKSGYMIMGNTTMAARIEQTSECIKRDIVFNQSLYLN